jgi:hypothetical protein
MSDRIVVIVGSGRTPETQPDPARGAEVIRGLAASACEYAEAQYGPNPECYWAGFASHDVVDQEAPDKAYGKGVEMLIAYLHAKQAGPTQQMMATTQWQAAEAKGLAVYAAVHIYPDLQQRKDELN